MTVIELIEYLKSFNPNANVMFNNNGRVAPLEIYSWNDGLGDSNGPRDIAKEKANAITVSFTCDYCDMEKIKYD